MNTTKINFELEDSALQSNLLEKILILVIWVLLAIIGNGLIIGIIQFDRFGGDPLKRRIIDQVLN